MVSYIKDNVFTFVAKGDRYICKHAHDICIEQFNKEVEMFHKINNITDEPTRILLKSFDMLGKLVIQNEYVILLHEAPGQPNFVVKMGKTSEEPFMKYANQKSNLWYMPCFIKKISNNICKTMFVSTKCVDYNTMTSQIIAVCNNFTDKLRPIGFVHGDLKRDNILINGIDVRLIDFEFSLDLIDKPFTHINKQNGVGLYLKQTGTYSREFLHFYDMFIFAKSIYGSSFGDVNIGKIYHGKIHHDLSEYFSQINAFPDMSLDAFCEFFVVYDVLTTMGYSHNYRQNNYPTALFHPENIRSQTKPIDLSNFSFCVDGCITASLDHMNVLFQQPLLKIRYGVDNPLTPYFNRIVELIKSTVLLNQPNIDVFSDINTIESVKCRLNFGDDLCMSSENLLPV